jgi:hypothetical protein
LAISVRLLCVLDIAQPVRLCVELFTYNVVCSSSQRMMDAELFGQSSLAQTFEWKKNAAGDDANGELSGDDVDIDMSVLKNLMEAQSQAMGSPLAGPLGQLMAQLGVTLPAPPPMHGKRG